MRGLTDRDRLVSEYAVARAQLYAAIQGLSEEQMGQPAPDGWSAKDHLAHLAAWHEFRFFEIGRIARGGRHGLAALSAAETDSLNDMFLRARRSHSAKQVLEDLEFARELVLGVIANGPESALDDSLYGEVGLRGGAAHDREHAEHIAELRKAQGL